MGKQITKTISYRLQFIDSARFTANSLSNLVNNIAEGIHRITCKHGHDDKKCETCRINYKDCEYFLQYRNFKDNLKKYKCSCCNKNYQKKFDEKLKERFFNTCNNYSHLNIEDVTDADYSHTKRVCKDFEIKPFGENPNLYVQGNTLLLADVFGNFRNVCLKIYELDPTRFLTASVLAWQEALKKTKVKLGLLTDNDMLLMVEKRY